MKKYQSRLDPHANRFMRRMIERKQDMAALHVLSAFTKAPIDHDTASEAVRGLCLALEQAPVPTNIPGQKPQLSIVPKEKSE